MTDKTDSDITSSMWFHAIGKCHKHCRFYESQCANIVMKVSEIGYKGDYYK